MRVFLWAVNINWSLNFLSEKMDTLVDFETPPLAQSRMSVSCPEHIFKGLSSSSGPPFHFLSLGFSFSQFLLRAVCLLAPLTSRTAERFPECLIRVIFRCLSKLLLGLLLQTCREDSFSHPVSTSSSLGCHLGKCRTQLVATVHMTLLLVLWTFSEFATYLFFLFFVSFFDEWLMAPCRGPRIRKRAWMQVSTQSLSTRIVLLF